MEGQRIYESESHPFEIVTEHGDRAEADSEAAALLAARTLRTDYVGDAMGRPPAVHILFEGVCVMTIPSEGSV